MSPTTIHRMPGRATLALALCLGAASAQAAKFSDWTAAVPVAEVNSPFSEGCPIEGQDGKTLFIASNRPTTAGPAGNDIWYSTRTASGWSEPVNAGPPVNTTANDFCPTPLHGKWLFFVSERTGPETCGAMSGSGDIYVTRNNPAKGWETPVHLGCAGVGAGGPNSTGPEFSPSIVETAEGTFLYYSSNGGSGLQDIYMSRMREDGTFGPGQVVTELSLPEFDDRMPNVRKDGLEIVFSSNRTTWGGGMPAYGSQDVYVSRRARTDLPWSEPVNVGPAVNTPGAETRSTLSFDGERLYFGRDGDIYVSTRTRMRGE